jgi:hypothetical protein
MVSWPARVRDVVVGDGDEHVAAALDHNGALLGVESFPASAAGHQDLHEWLNGFGGS